MVLWLDHVRAVAKLPFSGKSRQDNGRVIYMMPDLPLMDMASANVSPDLQVQFDRILLVSALINRLCFPDSSEQPTEFTANSNVVIAKDMATPITQHSNGCFKIGLHTVRFLTTCCSLLCQLCPSYNRTNA